MHGRSWSKRGLVALVLPWLLTSGGCRMHGAVDSSTISKDRSLTPRGRTIPPAGFGVDLVEAKRDAAVEPASGR